MRASRVITNNTNWDHMLQQNSARSVLMLINTDVVNGIVLQAGPSPGSPEEGWPVPAGNVFTLDPANPIFAHAIQGDWWVSSPTGAAVTIKLFVG